jgi:hypothetical protein
LLLTVEVAAAAIEALGAPFLAHLLRLLPHLLLFLAHLLLFLAHLLALLASLVAFGLLLLALLLVAVPSAVAVVVLRKRGRSRCAGQEHPDKKLTHIRDPSRFLAARSAPLSMSNR